ncbi:MAG: PqqD family peptide modification chaperone [Desulfobulbaceae bacterium]|nr:PqqD family peptide modification chaperone [Desulfobulbaceae bacterium]
MPASVLSINNPALDTLILSRAQNCISTVLDGETVILDMDCGVYNSANEIGSYIWALLEEPQPFSAIRESTLAEYEVSEEQCTIDLLAFLKEMLDHKLIIIDDN